MRGFSSSLRSKSVPSFITEGLSDPREVRRAQLKGELEAEVLQGLHQGVMSRTAFMQSVPHIKHGAGVVEAQHDMSIWEVQGDTIIRRRESEMEAEAVLSALKASEKTEDQ